MSRKVLMWVVGVVLTATAVFAAFQPGSAAAAGPMAFAPTTVGVGADPFTAATPVPGLPAGGAAAPAQPASVPTTLILVVAVLVLFAPIATVLYAQRRRLGQR